MKVQPKTRRKAISGILAGLIFFAMLFTAGIGLALYTFTSFNSYDVAQAGAVQAAEARSAESLNLRSCDPPTNPLPTILPWTGTTCPAGQVGVWFQNTGGIAVTIVNFWILDSSTNQLVIGYSPQSPPPVTVPSLSPSGITLNPGATLKVAGVPVVIETNFNPGASTDLYSITFITSSGNEFSATYPPPPLPELPPTLTTSLSSVVVAPPQSVTDLAALSGVTSNAAGTITFYYFTDGTCGSSGGTQTAEGSVPVSGPKNNYGPSSSVAFTISQIGKQFSWNAFYSGDVNNLPVGSPCEPLTVSNLAAVTSFGIGALSFDFEKFLYYTGPPPCSTSGLPPTGCVLTQVGRAFAISASSLNAGYLAWSVTITNVDPLGRTIVLGSDSYVEAQSINNQRGGGNAITFAYQIGSVSGSTVQASYTPISIAVGQSVTVYFVSMITGANPPGGKALNVTPLFLLFTGTIGGASWGENFPLTTVDWVA